ncbi:MAG: response regulator with CheY-like receiver domain and winged-helix DNA-binding domain [Bacillota bacterium]|nr:MAG: response regulator with CheY-like receiver domain and winged-helix DNA-binding domain [Bacillota bacterium]
MKKILLIEDEEKIAKLVAEYLTSEGFSVVTMGDGEAGLAGFNQERPDLVLLDVMLPKLSGLEVCSQLRQKTNIPIIMLTARSEEIDKLLGLGLGADDYITKPFSLRELVARIKAVLRRGTSEQAATRLAFEDMTLDTEQHTLITNGSTILLTPTEFRLLEIFLRSPGRVFTRAQLLEGAMGETFEGYERSIDTHIRNLRRKLEKETSKDYITTVFGIGYKLGASRA